MAQMAPTARVITPQRATLHYDSHLQVWKAKASRQEDSTTGHFDAQDAQDLLTLAQAIAWLLSYFAGNSVTEAAAALAPMGDLNALGQQIQDTYHGLA